MIFDDSLFTPDELHAIGAQATASGLDPRTWVRERILSGITPETQARLHPAVTKALDAVDVALDEGSDRGGNPHHAESEGGAFTFGLPPTQRPAAEGPHPRTVQSSLATGPIATTENAFAHPCRYLLREYHPNFGPNDSQGTCDAPNRKGSVCSWPPGSARSCSAFLAKVLPVKPPSPPPRALG